jgi:carboxyl-terminal processing protease
MIFSRVSRKIRIGLLAGFLSVSSILFLGFSGDNFEVVKNLDIYYSLFRELSLFYVDEVDPGEIIKTSMDKMLESLDPYTVYIPESKIEDYRFMTTGQYGGVGAVFKIMGDWPVVTEVYEDSPASRAGLKAGDVIQGVNRQDTRQRNLVEVNDLLNGQPNTRVALTIQRPGQEALMEKTITREEVKLNSVPVFRLVEPEIGYIKLNSFTQTSSREIREALVNLKEKQGAKSLILDLRGNPGGLLQEAVEIMNLFVGQGQEIVSTKGKVKEFDQVYKTRKPPLDESIPIVVLVNSGSASASEIVSGALQDLDRAVVVGQRSFGKGLVQTVRDLSYNSKLKLTTAKYYIPSGRCIQALDYTHRKADGSVGRIPDSLVSVFSTAAGRTVFDGGGVMPDVYLNLPPLAAITQALIDQYLIFDYATLFVQKHSQIDSPDEFRFSESDYQDFVKFVSDKTFSYESKTSDLLKKLKEVAGKEKYLEVARSEFAALEKKLARDRRADLLAFQEEISELLAQEIVARYYFEGGKVAYSFRADPYVSKAKELLKNSLEYQRILSPGFVIPKNPPE